MRETKTYWIYYPRDFANEYTVGIATTAEESAEYQDRGFERISRRRAEERINNRGDDATAVYSSIEVDNEDYCGYEVSARKIIDSI